MFEQKSFFALQMFEHRFYFASEMFEQKSCFAPKMFVQISYDSQQSTLISYGAQYMDMLGIQRNGRYCPGNARIQISCMDMEVI